MLILICRRIGFIHTADEVIPLADGASMPADEASSFGHFFPQKWP